VPPTLATATDPSSAPALDLTPQDREKILRLAHDCGTPPMVLLTVAMGHALHFLEDFYVPAIVRQRAENQERLAKSKPPRRSR